MVHSINSTANADVLSVSQLNRQARVILENEFPAVWVAGELSNMACPSSGHWYFSLKDQQAQIRCAMFKNRNRLVNFKPDNGIQVLVRGKISLYEGRGDFQLIVESIELFGDGLLRQQFEQLKAQLQAKGWFDASSKQPLAKFPSTIGVVTSPTGAALRDIIKVITRRHPSAQLIIYPTQVQGQQAAASIAKAISCANQHNACDTLILARGGGSLEDLWGFNEYVVAEALHHSHIPVITGIGHEIDFTIADFVADHRAPTPSAAAELATPDGSSLAHQISMYQDRLLRCINILVNHYHQHLNHLQKRLQSPSQRLQQLAQRLDELELRLHRACQQQLKSHSANLASLARALHAVSPLATLDRGFAIVTDPEKNVITSTKNCEIGQVVYTQLSDGTLTCQIKDLKDRV